MYLHECDIPCLKVRHLLGLFLFLFSLLNCANGNIKLVSSFRSKTFINNVLIRGDRVYVAAVNSLYLLNATNLSILEQTNTGPVLDSPECSPTLENCIGSRDSIQQTDNVNKILQYLSSQQLLLICGSVRQGSCEWRQPENLKLNTSSSLSTSVPVAANGAQASTIASAFVDEHGEEKLYVAASYAVDSPYREAFPAVATRLVPSLLPLNSGAIDGEASVVVRAEFRSRFYVRYVSTFTDEHYVYWATVQSRDAKSSSSASPLVSRLIRVCRDDDKYISYSEIEIQCRGEDNTNYNVVRDLKHVGTDLIGVFNDAVGRNSAICIFKMSQIRLTFWYNIDRCWSGTDYVGLSHFGRDSKCINKSQTTISEDTCRFGVGGTLEASQMASAQFSDRTLTSVAGRSVHGHTLVVVGSKAGDIIQMEMLGEHNKRLELYDDFVTGPDPIQKLEFVNDEQYYATNDNELLVYKISSCPAKPDCEACVAAKDPLCGFCLSEGKCVPQIECQTGLVRQCPRRRDSITPTNISISSTNASVFIPIENLPEPDVLKSYECYFGAFKAKAKYTTGRIECSLPDQRPQLAADQDSVTVPLAVRGPVSRYNIVEQNFTFFDCSRHTICSKCASAQWPCGWCSSRHMCVSDTECSIPLSSVSECSRIDVSRETNLLVADSTNASLVFPVLNMDSDSSKDLFCVISDPSNDRKQVVPATLTNRGRVKCRSAEFKYDAESLESNFTLELVQNRDIIDKIQLTVYKCGLMGTDCSQCLALNPKYHCTWCANGCHFHDKCLVKPSKSKADILCNEPVIQSFYPVSGPIEGGTQVEIFGRDLGLRIQDVRDRVIVGGSKCKVVGYEVSVKIVCIVEAGAGSGPIRIAIGTGRRTVESTEHYRFLEPVIQSIYPNFGPLSGGTRLAIYGENLNVGANVTMFLDNHPCKLLDETPRLSNEIFCRTSGSQRVYTVTAIRLQIDDTVRILSTNFEYRPDPFVDSISPLFSVESGGRNLLVEGSNFNSILAAQMFLLSDAHDEQAFLVSEISKCYVLNSTQMTCKSPRLVRSNTEIVRHLFNRFAVGFAMDGVKAVRNLGRKLQLTTTPDPQFAPFKGVRTLALGQPLAIEGKQLDLAATAAEYNVTIGTVPCPIIVLEPTQLVCRTPEELPALTDDFGRELKDGRVLVVVRLGHIRVEIGPLEFADAQKIQASAFLRTNLLRIVMLIIFAIGILGASGLLLFMLWGRNNENERTYKRIKLQMEQLECNVRNECKKAFAELQTDMNDFQIEDMAVPFNERNEFINRLLFRDNIDSSILNGYGTAGIYSTRFPMAIIQFESLLYNRHFLFVLVKMVDTNAGISMSERSTLSSLLISVMSRDMSYCTEVVFSLLSTHIQQLAQNKMSVGLLFRQSDSLTEKLFQHWLSLTLFPALLEPNGSGRRLFLLYKALKYQCEKGPIDACTGNARYSLSEQKLLRESIDCTPIVLLIMPVLRYDQEPIPLRVLDCDTILQVKTKLLDLLYRNVPFSKRMNVDQFDLEMRCPRRGNILLLDDDQPQAKGLKKLHTVSYYGLQTNSVLIMQQRGQHSFTFRSESGGSSDTTCSAWSSAHLIDSNGLPISPLGSCHQNSVQYYHLSAPNHSNFMSLPNTFLSLDKKQRKQHNLKRHNSQQQLFTEDCHLTKNIPEVFLTRMVMCKGTVQEYINSFFDSITFATSDTGEVPVVLKYVMDFLDLEAARNNITDPQIVHAWKTNAYVLRFWMQLLHNPDSLFDIQRQQCIDASLTVIGQTLIDAFSINNMPLGKESPSSKLLFAKEIARYRPIASRMFTLIRQHPSVDEERLIEYIKSMSTTSGFSAQTATNELLNWSKANVLRLSELLDQDAVALKLRLGERLQESVRCSLPPSETEHVYATLQ